MSSYLFLKTNRFYNFLPNWDSLLDNKNYLNTGILIKPKHAERNGEVHIFFALTSSTVNLFAFVMVLPFALPHLFDHESSTRQLAVAWVTEFFAKIPRARPLVLCQCIFWHGLQFTLFNVFDMFVFVVIAEVDAVLLFAVIKFPPRENLCRVQSILPWGVQTITKLVCVGSLLGILGLRLFVVGSCGPERRFVCGCVYGWEELKTNVQSHGGVEKHRCMYTWRAF